MGDRLPHRLGRIGAVDPVEAFAEIHGPDPQRILRMSARHMDRQVGILPAHLGRGRPARVHFLYADTGLTGPAGITLGRRDRVADGSAVWQNVIEPGAAKLDEDSPGLIAGREGHKVSADHAGALLVGGCDRIKQPRRDVARRQGDQRHCKPCGGQKSEDTHYKNPVSLLSRSVQRFWLAKSKQASQKLKRRFDPILSCSDAGDDMDVGIHTDGTVSLMLCVALNEEMADSGQGGFVGFGKRLADRE